MSYKYFSENVSTAGVPNVRAHLDDLVCSMQISRQKEEMEAFSRKRRAEKQSEPESRTWKLDADPWIGVLPAWGRCGGLLNASLSQMMMKRLRNSNTNPRKKANENWREGRSWKWLKKDVIFTLLFYFFPFFFHNNVQKRLEMAIYASASHSPSSFEYTTLPRVAGVSPTPWATAMWLCSIHREADFLSVISIFLSFSSYA